MEMQKPRPPYVTFERKPEEDRSDFVEGAPMKFKDVDYAYITPIGSKDRIERRVSEWFPQLLQQIREGRAEQSWYDAYKATYEAWKNDQEPPVNGTSIKAWPVLSPAQVKSLVALRILAVEDLAEANEETLSRIGMGSRSLKLQAIDWLKSKEKDGVSSLIQQVSAMRLQLEALGDRNTLLEVENKKLQAEQKAAA